MSLCPLFFWFGRLKDTVFAQKMHPEMNNFWKTASAQGAQVFWPEHLVTTPLVFVHLQLLVSRTESSFK